jgi:hypothetical protein
MIAELEVVTIETGCAGALTFELHKRQAHGR